MTTAFKNDLQLLPEVKTFLGRNVLPAIVGGQEVMAASGATLATIDPGSGKKLAEIQDLDASEVDRAVDVASAAFPAWAKLSLEERSKLLLRLADAVEKRKPIIAQIEALDAGKIEAQAQGDVQN
ncbi:MAG: aldehyde dehydrogenase family protein, partial [Planctomycetales bacterium]|nr:aldehyde dehydrogenase family protein [Planctomycetales bacterium]